MPWGKHEDFTGVVINTTFDGSSMDYDVKPVNLPADEDWQCDFCPARPVYEVDGDQANYEVAVLYCQRCMYEAATSDMPTDTYTRPFPTKH